MVIEAPIWPTYVLVRAENPGGSTTRHEHEFGEQQVNRQYKGRRSGEGTHTSIRAIELFIVSSGYVGSGLIPEPLTYKSRQIQLWVP